MGYQIIWVVSYCDDGDLEPTVTVFNNGNAAANCKQSFINAGHQRVSLDACPLYSRCDVANNREHSTGHGIADWSGLEQYEDYMK